MDSKSVNKALKQLVVPFLKENSFILFTSRSAWRFRDDKIEVVNFQSFNPCLASGLGCTTFSFGVNLGIFFKDIPVLYEAPKERNGYPCPEEYQCHFRSPLLKKLVQTEYSRDDIWYIDSEGSNLKEAVLDVRRELIEYGLPWFKRFDNKSEVLRTLLEDEEHIGQKVNGTFGFGNKPSPIRSYQTGYIAMSIGDYKLAEKALKEAINSGCFKFERLKSDYESIISNS